MQSELGIRQAGLPGAGAVGQAAAPGIPGRGGAARCHGFRPAAPAIFSRVGTAPSSR